MTGIYLMINGRETAGTVKLETDGLDLARDGAPDHLDGVVVGGREVEFEERLDLFKAGPHLSPPFGR